MNTKLTKTIIATTIAALALTACTPAGPAPETPNPSVSAPADADKNPQPEKPAPEKPAEPEFKVGDEITSEQSDMLPAGLKSYITNDGRRIVVDPVKPLPKAVAKEIDSTLIRDGVTKTDGFAGNEDKWIKEYVSKADGLLKTVESMSFMTGKTFVAVSKDVSVEKPGLPPRVRWYAAPIRMQSWATKDEAVKAAKSYLKENATPETAELRILVDK